ncbi:ARSK [Symbiodinium sp. CCMP2592]|nr:ARSK [Symbiodinium sp. CCMP2592]
MAHVLIPRSETAFKKDICAPLGYLAQWQNYAIRTFGQVATGSPAFGRLIETLQTRQGLEKVKSCQQSGTALHGKSSSDIGIQDLLRGEVNQLWLEFKKQKAGAALVSKKPEATMKEEAKDAPTGQTQTETLSDTATASGTSIEVVDLSMTVLPEEPEDPVQKAAREKSHAELDHVFIQTDKSLLLEAVIQKMTNSSQKVCCIIDAQTSRAKVSLDYVEIFRNFVVGHGLTRYSFVVIVGQRIDLLHAVHTKVAVQADMPYVVNILRHRATPAEQIRKRCLRRDCPLRDDTDRSEMLPEGKTVPANHELPEDDRETDPYSVEPADEGATATSVLEDDTPPGLPGTGNDNDSGPRDYLIDLWPFARPVGYYEQVLDEILKATGCQTVLVMSVSAHPAPWIAVRKLLHADCFVLADRLRRHSMAHAKEIALQYFYRVAYKDLDKRTGPRKRLLGQADVQVMMSPHISGQQIIEFLEVPVDSSVDQVPTDLPKFLNGLVDRELEKNNLYLQSNEGCLSLKAKTRNNCGIGAKCEVLVSYGLDYDLTGAKKPRLESFFKAKVEGEGVQDVKMETRSEAEAAAKETEETPQEENPGARPTGNQPEPVEVPESKPEPPTAPSKKRSDEDEENLQETIVKHIDDPPCDFILLENDTSSESGFGIRIRSMADVNRRLPKHWLVTSYQQGKLIRVNNEQFPEACLRYEVAMTDLVIDMSVTPKTVCTMKELVKTSGQLVADGNHCLTECEPLHYKLAEAMQELTSIGLAWGFQKAQNKLVNQRCWTVHAESKKMACVFWPSLLDEGLLLMAARWAKSSPWEPSVKIPLILAGPSIRKDAIEETPVSLIDVPRTLLDFAGATPAQAMGGYSLLPALRGSGPVERPAVLSGLYMPTWEDSGWRTLSEYFESVAALFSGGQFLKLVCCPRGCSKQGTLLPFSSLPQVALMNVTSGAGTTKFEHDVLNKPSGNGLAEATHLAEYLSLGSNWTCFVVPWFSGVG